MPEIVYVRPADLLINEENPRLSEPNSGQREAFRALAKNQQRKLQKLAEHIVENGLNPSKMPIVAPAEGDTSRYVVLEGNRRLAALRALENPESVADSVNPSVLQQIRRLSKRYHEEPVELVQCVSVKDRGEASPWIELEHTGENEGAGMVGWSSAEAARFRARRGDLPPHLQVLEFLQQRGDLDPSQGIAVTSLKRLIETPGVREKLGIALEKKKLYRIAEEEPVAKALRYVVENLPPVGRIYTLDDRLKFANKLPQQIKVTPTIEDHDKVPLESGATSPQSKRTTTHPRTPRPRTRLIPNTCVLNVTDERVRGIEHELRRLDINRFPNAVSVLMRVFIELSTDCYASETGLNVKPEDNLSKKLQVVAKELVQRKKLTQAQAKPVNRACSGKMFLVPSVKLMHQYVHNPYVFPAPGDLLAHWNSLQPFITALWSV